MSICHIIYSFHGFTNVYDKFIKPFPRRLYFLRVNVYTFYIFVLQRTSYFNRKGKKKQYQHHGFQVEFWTYQCILEEKSSMYMITNNQKENMSLSYHIIPLFNKHLYLPIIHRLKSCLQCGFKDLQVWP